MTLEVIKGDEEINICHFVEFTILDKVGQVNKTKVYLMHFKPWWSFRVTSTFFKSPMEVRES